MSISRTLLLLVLPLLLFFVCPLFDATQRETKIRFQKLICVSNLVKAAPPDLEDAQFRVSFSPTSSEIHGKEAPSGRRRGLHAIDETCFEETRTVTTLLLLSRRPFTVRCRCFRSN